ncbi:MAG TPA: hypothetical protein VLF40_03890 [Candidatus Saccharimonadales bacterium]|nr:hypothetical protein [Candidatus Saccharimonadales bacterium]
MTDAGQLAVEAAVSAGELVADREQLNGLVAHIGTAEAVNPALVVRGLEACSPHLTILFGADIGLLRAARLGEHTEADLSGFESYAELFPEPEHRQILRFGSLARDSGKSWCVKATGDNREQTAYNTVVTDALLDAVDSEVMADDAKEVVRLLVEYDIVGNALQGRFDQAKLDELRARWPVRLADQLEDFVVASYLSDASAHTAYRTFTDMDTGEARPCVTPEDVSLDFLFEPPVDSSPLTLTQPYRRAVAAIFPHRRATHDLMRDDTPREPATEHDYPYITEADGIWSATMSLDSQPYEVVKGQIEAFAMSTGVPISAFVKRGRGDTVSTVTLVRDPSRRFGTPLPEVYEHAAAQVSILFGWERQQNPSQRPDVSACVGLLEGYDEETGTLHKPVEVVTALLEQGNDVAWQTEPTTLVSARRVLNGQQYELQTWDERVMRVTGNRRAAGRSEVANPALQRVKVLAGSFKQQRFFAEDGISNNTVALAA